MSYFRYGRENNEGDYEIDDGSNAVYNTKGKGKNQYWEFSHYDKDNEKSKDQKDEVNHGTLIEEQEKMNLSNKSLEKDENGNTYCSHAVNNVIKALASTPGNEHLKQYAIFPASKINLKMLNDGLEVNKAEALNNAIQGGLSIEGIYRPTKAHDHVATFSVGDLINSGPIVNIGSKNQIQGFHTQQKSDKWIKFFILPLVK